MTRTTEDQFAAALAHQLKTPTSALEAATRNLRRNLRGLLEDLAALGGEQGPASSTARFIARVVGEPAPAPITGLLPEDRLDVIARRLSAVGLPGDVRTAAASLLRGGWDTYLDEIAPLLRGDRPLALDVLETAARLRVNLTSMEASLARVRGIAAALRLLSRPVDGGSVDVAESLKSSLALFRETLPAQVSVATRLDALPMVAGRADLLCEVWTNLISNAVQAVGSRGTITIEGEPRAAGASVEVRVIDDGHGIPAEAMSRIFEPFFTTRAADGGTGLGLAVSRRVVEKLGGRIAVESRPGRTCFTVVLPAAAAAQKMEA